MESMTHSGRAGDCDGSIVHEDHLEFLRQTRRLPHFSNVKVHVPPEREITPAPKGGERVVFRSHFLYGFGLPMRGFPRSFLDFYGV